MYTDDVNCQILIALLKEAGIRHVIVSPGSTNIPFSRSVQVDGYFTVYSAVDERSAAYMACGLAGELREPVVISCTGATASRNYLPGLTEAYYRKLPVLAVMSMNHAEDIGNLTTQIIDRTIEPRDVFLYKTRLDSVPSSGIAFSHACLEANRALYALRAAGGGPVGIELIDSGSASFTTRELPKAPLIECFEAEDEWPELGRDERVLVLLGSQPRYSANEEEALDRFLESRDSVAFTCVASGYSGRHAFHAALAAVQLVGNPRFESMAPALVIQVGEMTGDYDTNRFLSRLDCPIWRVSEDGCLRRTFGRLDRYFRCKPQTFFERYTEADLLISGKPFGVIPAYEAAWRSYDGSLRESCPDLPFSNIWMARELSRRLPAPSILHPAILSSMAAWNFFPAPAGVRTVANVGGFGIDGCASTLLGASLAGGDCLAFCITGDLAFFYDMNVLGNRHVSKRLRILLVNNNLGMTFKHSGHYAHSFGSDANEYIAAAGHFVNRFEGTGGLSPAGAWASSLGFEYLCATDKEGFTSQLEAFVTSENERPVLFECFTTEDDERVARDLVLSIDGAKTPRAVAKDVLKRAIGGRGTKVVKRMIGR